MDKIENKQQKGGSVDFMYLSKLLWKHRRLYYVVLPVAVVIALIIGFSIPKTYYCTVMLAPELSSSGTSRYSLASIARSFGMKLGSNMMGSNSEALFPTLYPDLMNSVDFQTSLFDIQVCAMDSVNPKSYYDYLLYDQKSPWWSAAIGGVVKGINKLIPDDDDDSEDDDKAAGTSAGGTSTKKKVNPFRLTKKQTDIAKKIADNVVCGVDEKTLVITIDVNAQDPLICATVADSVKVRLQEFITKYRTNKARIDLEYNRKLYKEAKARYEKARQLYVDYADANQDAVLQSVRSKISDLELEVQLQYNAYQLVVTQMQTSEALVQQQTPAFTTLQSATVPLKPTTPRKKRILLIFLALAFVGTSVYVLHKEKELKPLLGL